VRVSADGKRLLYLEQRTFTHVWSADIDGSNARQLTFDNQNLNVPEFSPDKTRISFDMGSADLLQSSNHVFIMDSDGTNRTQLTAGDAQYFHAAWSPDGRHMTYASKQVNEPMDSAQIYLIELENPETPRLIGKGIGVRWINEEKLLTVTIPNLGHPHTTLYSIHSREPIEASKDSTREYPLRDGRSVVVADYRKGREGWWIETRGAGQGSAPKQILSSACLLTSFLSANLRYIIYAEASGEVWRISIPEGKRERLPDILNGINPGSGDIQMSHDDKQLVFAREQLDSRLVLIENVFR
jgi:dipeptidyl aminopeptidase/acylaminoacyl peptidase